MDLAIFHELILVLKIHEKIVALHDQVHCISRVSLITPKATSP